MRISSADLGLCSNAGPHTAKEISDGLGQSEVEHIQKSSTDSKSGRTHSTSRQRSVEPSVMPSELMDLSPLRGFLKFAGAYPIARIRLVYQQSTARVKPFVER
ncbi:MAG: type IV secretion system DNA-binding domain-containing protein [Comamonadaceae bacterium]|nr:type IV secretion system DNA-binding domain-containing protein [Comamonadaceae bacterium]